MRHMARHSPDYKLTAMMRSSAGALASSMRCLEETMKVLDASRAVLNTDACLGKVSRPQNKTCWICGRAVCLETCKTDEAGCAVHEECYVAKIAFAKEFVRLSKISDS